MSMLKLVNTDGTFHEADARALWALGHTYSVRRRGHFYFVVANVLDRTNCGTEILLSACPLDHNCDFKRQCAAQRAK